MVNEKYSKNELYRWKKWSKNNSYIGKNEKVVPKINSQKK